MTKEETCVYCRSENYGGPACYECGYEVDKNGNEKDNIICKDCYLYEKYRYLYEGYYYDRYDYSYIFNSILSSDGKCYNYKRNSSDNCLLYGSIKDKNNIEKLTCTMCIPGYYFNSENKCISYKDKIKIFPNCQSHNFYIAEISHDLNYDENGDSNINFDYYSFYHLYNDTSFYNEALKYLTFPINTTCSYCKTGYYLHDNNECRLFEFSKWNLNNIIYNSYDQRYRCEEICNEYSYPFIYVKIVNYSLDLDNENYENIDYFRGIQNIYEYEFYELNNETRNIIGDIPLCYNISNENLRNKFEWCDSVIYIPTKKTYECFGCYYGFYLNQSNKTCLRNTSLNEEDPETINNCSIAENSAIYSCQSCYYYKETLVSFETGIKECIRDVSLENCLEATANSSYDSILYNCTSCDFNYLPYYSKFYGRQICQNIFEKITKNKNISLDIFDKKNSTKVDNKGNCPEKYFTPDGKNCYACDNEKVGMPGCNGKCSFSLKRNNSILCEADCKEGYLESSEGVCETCDNINKGCSECHYESNSLIYYGKRARTFQCDYCEPGYVLSETGKCIKCSDIMYKCDKCQKDEKTGGYKCTSCPKNFIYKDVNQDFGYCEECFVNEAIIKEKCVKCYDSSNGGVEKCKYCLTKDDGTEIVCNECFDDYILLSDNNTCLYRENNTELNQFDSCLELTLENGKYICSRCKPQYSLLKEGSEVKCAYIPTLFDYYFQPHYYEHYY